MPDVAVVMAAYNAEQTIRDAVESVLSTKINSRIYVVDDQSRIPVSDVLADLLDRIAVLRMPLNGGPAAARNAALELILQTDVKYVAIMDADDISTPERIDRQAAFMEQNPELGACGTFLREFHEHTGETIRIFTKPVAPEDVRKAMFFNIGIGHSSAMFRTEALRRVGVYSLYRAAEDYDLLRRIGAHYPIANIPECLVHYRISSQGQSLRLRRRQVYERMLIQLRHFEMLEWRAWAGVARSALSIVTPARLLQSRSDRIAAAGSKADAGEHRMGPQDHNG